MSLDIRPLAASDRAADDAGAAQVCWLTRHLNETARRLYDRIGVATPFIKYNRA